MRIAVIARHRSVIAEIGITMTAMTGALGDAGD